MSTLLPELPEPVARLLEWRGPAHMPVPHAGVAARTFAEFAKDTPVERRYWFEGEPLFTADQVRAIQIETWKAAIEAAAKVCDARSRCWGSDNYKLAAEDETCAMAIRSLPSPE